MTFRSYRPGWAFFFSSWDVCLPHLALIFLNTGHFHPTHRTIGQRLSYLQYLTVVWSDDADIIGGCRDVEM